MSDERTERGEGGRQLLVAEFVLGLLGPAEHARVAAMIDADPALAAERDFWASRFASLDEQFVETAPPASVLPRLEKRLFAGAPRVGWWESLALWRSLTAGALTIAVVATGLAFMRPAADVSTLTTQLVAALEEQGSDVRFIALYDGSGAVRLTALSGSETPDKDLELWAIQGDQAPISMGVIPVNERSSVELSEKVRQGWGAGSVLAITLEPKGGSPNGEPTGPIVAKGEVHSI